MDTPAVRHRNMTTHPGQACDMEDSRKSHSQDFLSLFMLLENFLLFTKTRFGSLGINGCFVNKKNPYQVTMQLFGPEGSGQLELSVAFESHMRCIFLSARSFKTSCMSCKQQRPHFRNSRNRKPSIALVKASASCAAL